MRCALRRDLRLGRAYVGDGDGYGKRFASEVGRLRGRHDDTKCWAEVVHFRHGASCVTVRIFFSFFETDDKETVKWSEDTHGNVDDGHREGSRDTARRTRLNARARMDWDTRTMQCNVRLRTTSTLLNACVQGLWGLRSSESSVYSTTTYLRLFWNLITIGSGSEASVDRLPVSWY